MDNNLPDDQKQKNLSQDDNQSQVKPTSTFNKERGGWGPVEQDTSLAEYKEPDLPKETEGWLEKLEKGEDIKLPQPVTDDQDQVILDDIQPKTEKIELPLTQNQANQGLHHKIWSSFRWLAEWCLRAARLKSDKFVYKKVKHAR